MVRRTCQALGARKYVRFRHERPRTRQGLCADVLKTKEAMDERDEPLLLHAHRAYLGSSARLKSVHLYDRHDMHTVMMACRVVINM
jgi:hypothetical protein